MSMASPSVLSARADFADRTAIVGIGVSDFARHGGITDRTEFQLCCEAIMAAAEDAGLDVREIDGFCSYATERHEPSCSTGG